VYPDRQISASESRDSPLDIASGYELEGMSSTPSSAKFFSSHPPDPRLTQPPIQWILGSPSRG
jgi:hypothetical protein